MRSHDEKPVFMPTASIEGDVVTFYNEDVFHIHDTLAKNVGDTFHGRDSQGYTYRLHVASLTGDELVARVIERRETHTVPPAPISLVLGGTSEKSIGNIIEFAAQLRVATITLCTTERDHERETDVVNARAVFEDLAQNASDAVGRTTPLKVEGPLPFKTCMEAWKAKDDCVKVFPYELEEETTIPSLLAKAKECPVALAIGGTAGYTDSEVTIAREAGFVPVTLGSAILRVDVAAVYAISLIRNMQMSVADDAEERIGPSY